MVAPPLPVDPDPFNVAEFMGKVMLCDEPASAVGAIAAAAFTVIVTVDVLVKPLLSVTVNVNT